MNLQIQCPSCTKRFTVHEDLTGKTVECGACDHRFPVKSDSIIEERTKFYPGESKGNDFLNRLGRDAKAPKQDSTVKAAASSYTHASQVDAIMPSSAGHRIATATGLGLLLFYGLVFLLGAGKDGAFQDVLMVKRLILGGFVSLLGGGLIIFGAKNWRFRSILLSLFLVAGLMTMIKLMPVHETPSDDGRADMIVSPSDADDIDAEPLNETEIKARVGFLGMQRKIDAMIDEHGAEGSDYVVGIFIENLKGREYLEIEKYLLKSLYIPPSEGIGRYTRNNEKDSLLVISGVALDFDTVVRRCDPRLGKVTTYPGLRLIDLQLSSDLFTEPSAGLLQKLTDSSHPAFFSNNLNELTKLDPTRVNDAIRRLANVRSGVQLKHADEILNELMRILPSEKDPVVLSDLGKALCIWAGNDGACVDFTTKNVTRWIKNDEIVPKSFVNYLIDNEAPDAVAIVDALWKKDPGLWSPQYIALGAPIEKYVLFHLEESPLNLKKSALLILAKIGTPKSLSALTKVTANGDPEMKILAEQAIAAIKSQ